MSDALSSTNPDIWEEYYGWTIKQLEDKCQVEIKFISISHYLGLYL